MAQEAQYAYIEPQVQVVLPMSCFLVSGEVQEIIQQAKAKSHKNLYLNYQQLSELPPELLQLEKAEKLFLKYNILKNLPSDIYQLKSLVELYLHSNNLQELPDEIGHLPCLKSLNVSNNFLTTIPTSIGQLKQLEYLHLANNKLSFLCESLGNLHSLRVLDVMNNLLTRLPWQLCYSHKLENLLFDNNSIEGIPRQLMNLEHLKEISGSNNKLVSLPQDLDHLLSLESLILDSNVNLCALPGTLLKVPYLSTLGINSCGQLTDDKTKGTELFGYFHGVQFYGDSEQTIPPLIELSLRATHQFVQSCSPPFSLPGNFDYLLQTPLGHCFNCGQPFFLAVFLFSTDAKTAINIAEQQYTHSDLSGMENVHLEFVFALCSIKCFATIKHLS